MADKLFFGLNTERTLSDLQNKNEGLNNLNLNLLDLNVFRGINNEGVVKNDLKRISGLDVDAKKELSSIFDDASRTIDLMSETKNFLIEYDSNIIVDSQVLANSFRYKFLDYSKSNNFISFGEVSTSRVSAWSSLGPDLETSPIFYGAQVEIIEDQGSSNVRLNNLEFTKEPREIKYNAEIPTHLLKLKINGEEKEFYAMKGIPLEFSAFFQSANFKFEVNGIDGIQPTVVVNDIENETFVEYENNPTDQEIEITFSGSTPSEKRIDFYYPNNNFESFTLQNLNLISIPENVLPNLKEFNLQDNNLIEVPNFKTITPTLNSLNLAGNLFSTQNKSAQEQLSSNNLPNTIKELDISGCFQTNENLDLTHLTNLERFTFLPFSRFRENPTFFISNSEISPDVNQSSILFYNIENQSFKNLPESVLNAENLLGIFMSENNIESSNISFASTVLRDFRVGGPGNEHNIVKVNGKTNLNFYSDTRRNVVNGNKTLDFQGCTNLSFINVFRNTQATGNIQNLFRELPDLDRIDIRYTNIYGILDNLSFFGTNKLRQFFIGNSSLNLDENGDPIATDFFSENCLLNLSLLESLRIDGFNFDIIGNFPNFTANENLNLIRIDRTNMNGDFPNFNNNERLETIQILRNPSFTSNVPSLALENLKIFQLFNNSNTGSMPTVFAPNLEQYDLRFNNFSGTISGVSENLQLERILLNNNNFSDYEEGTLRNLTKLRLIYLYNNNLSLENLETIIEDVRINYESRPRSLLNLNISGNVSNPVFDNTTINNINFLRSNGVGVTI